jgi:Family of unknown function (DUF5427)
MGQTDADTHRRMAKPKGGEDVLSLLDSLGESAPPETTSTLTQDPATTENETELLGFLDNLAKQPARAQTPRPTSVGVPRTGRDSTKTSPAKKSTEKVVEKSGDSENAEVPVPSVKIESPTSQSGGGGGWFGGLWNIGSAAMKTAEQKVKELQQTEEAKAWEEKVRGNVSVLGKLSIPHLGRKI